MRKAYSLISEVDKSLENPIALQYYFLTDSEVYRIERNGSMFVLKIAVVPRIKSLRWMDDVAWNHLEREREALRRAQSEYISHLVFDYGTYAKSLFSEYSAILKEYVEGEHIWEDNKVSDTTTQKQLEETIRDLHKQGLANFDLDIKGNLILNPDNIGYLVDFGLVSFKNEISDREFNEIISKDLRDLQRFFS